MTSFCHLHCHSEYSLLDGLGRTADLARQAAKLGQPALALTDHGVMHGAVEFFRNCKKHGVKPVIGMEAYLTLYGRPMDGTDPNKDKDRHHLLLLAQNMTGYKNLLKIASDAQLKGFYYKPRIDADYLAEHAEGLICTTGCMAAEIPSLLNPENGRPPQPELALQRLMWYLEVFGRERFFIELQEHSIPALTQINKTLFEWGKKYGLEFIVTNDVHYVTAADAQAHDTLLCVQTNSLVDQQNRMRLSDFGYYLKSEEEMRALFRPLADLPESAFTNTLKIAEMCEVDLEDKSFHLPDPFEPPAAPIELNGRPAVTVSSPPATAADALFADRSLPWLAQIPEEYITARDYPAALRHLTEQGLRERYGDRADSPEVQARKEHELNIINSMGFAPYYLIVWDLCRYAQARNIWWNVRGSGAGSIVAYAIGITLIDPLRHNLIFERFLNPGRVSMPDFDLDYPDDQREYMIDYARRRYGDKRVAQIVSFGRMKARAAIRDVGRAMNIPLPEVDRIAKMISAIPGKPATIDNALDPEHEFFSPELKQLYETDDRIRRLIDSARQLEGVARHSSVHAAAVIITDQDLTEYVPVMRGQGAVVTESVTQFEFPICESIGLLKVDFLGLSTLTVMRKACELIKQRHGLEFNLHNLPMDNPELFKKQYPHFPPPEKAFELLAKGDVTGVFQVEGSGMRRVLTDMKPTRFEHIVAAISLFRPGPMEYIPTYIARMHGKEPVEFKHPRLEPILAETYGIIVYQEQIIQIASQLAGYAPGDADRIRKAVGKKKKEEIDAHRAKFIKGAVENGIPKETAEAIYSDIEFFARYGFNKAHAADYALVTCQTAYLKAHFPVEYMAALLTVERGNTDKVGMLVGECRAMGIDIVPPNVNYGGIEFIIEEQDGQSPRIHFSLSAIKNVGEGPVETIVRARQEGGPFKDIDDFCNRVDLRQVGRRALECLIKVGALDDFGDRPTLLAIIDRMLNLSGSTHKAASVGQLSMFEMEAFDAPQTGSIMYPLPEVEPVSRKEMLAWEKELAGAYLSAHPIQKFAADIKASGSTFISELDETAHGKTVQVVGMVSSVRHHQTKKGDPMAFVEIEDLHGSCELIVFPRAYSAHKDLLAEGNLVVVRGKVELREGRPPQILVDSISNQITTYRPAANGSAGNGQPQANGHPAPPPSVAEPTMPYMPPPPPPPPEEMTTTTRPAPAQRRLHVVLRRTRNLAQDRHLLKTVYNLLTEQRGEDRFTLYIPDGKRKIRIEFPQQTTRHTAHLEQRLIQLLGAKSVWVE
ncbi:MAG: DNA polymerase III subunit alpha [Chloroflexi bacterium]|nr:MAG: DNA polymerase III subunit alpha [Chloroflexota bacterium]